MKTQQRRYITHLARILFCISLAAAVPAFAAGAPIQTGEFRVQLPAKMDADGKRTMLVAARGMAVSTQIPRAVIHLESMADGHTRAVCTVKQAALFPQRPRQHPKTTGSAQ